MPVFEDFDSLKEFTFKPDLKALNRLRSSWAWLLGERWSPLLFSAIGDLFFESTAGTIWWLSTATGDLEQVADTKEQFTDLLESERFDEWFLPGLVTYLHSEGKTLSEGQCYSYRTFPVFAQGSFSAENMFACEAHEHFTISGQIHRQLQGKGDGAEVTIMIGD